MTILSVNPHHAAAIAGLAQLKQLTNSLDGWSYVKELDGVSLYKSDPEENNALVRGDISVETLPAGCTFKQVVTVAMLPGCRKIWDERYDDSRTVVHYERYEALFWVRMNAPWPISKRDFAGISIREFNEKEAYVCMVSVEDEQVPEEKGNVRGKIIISGWKISQVGQGVCVTYINQVDLAGSIPVSFLNKLAIQIPLCAGKVTHYLTENGYPPTTTTDDKIKFIGEDFDHSKRAYSCEVEGKEGQVDIVCCQLMYPQGVLVKVDGQGEVVQDKDRHQNHTVRLNKVVGHVKVTLCKA